MIFKNVYDKNYLKAKISCKDSCAIASFFCNCKPNVTSFELPLVDDDYGVDVTSKKCI